MPLPEDVLSNLKQRIDTAKKELDEFSDVIEDLRAAGIDASQQEARQEELRDRLRKMEVFYDLQQRRVTGRA